MRVALDTNILAYAEGVNGAAMKRVALELLRKLPEGAVLLPVQALGELFACPGAQLPGGSTAPGWTLAT